MKFRITDKSIGQVGEYLWGSFLEQMGRAVYGGIYDPESAESDKRL